jgi:beta-N-acetylhexosaminidase
MGFDGVIVSDDIGGAAAVAGIAPAARAIDFLLAGGDMITSQTAGVAASMDDAVVARASRDAGFRAVVDAAVQRILAAKQASGLLPCG